MLLPVAMRPLRTLVTVALLMSTAGLLYGETAKKAAKAKCVHLHEAIENKLLWAKYVPRDDTGGRIILRNLTGLPLSVQLPEALAVVPVLAQFGPQPDAPQVGGAANEPQAIFNIAPEQVRRIDVPAVCLEHGKPNPRPTVHYEIRPLSSVTDKPEVRELLKMLGKAGPKKQKQFQAAVWHVTDDRSWKQLAAERIKRLGGRSPEVRFSRRDLAAAKKLLAKAKKRAGEASSKTSVAAR
jgi:hypothetical protein